MLVGSRLILHGESFCGAGVLASSGSVEGVVGDEEDEECLRAKSSVLASFLFEEGFSVWGILGEDRWGVWQTVVGGGLLGLSSSANSGLSGLSSSVFSVVLHFFQFVLQVIFNVKAFSSLSFLCSSGPIVFNFVLSML